LFYNENLKIANSTVFLWRMVFCFFKGCWLY